MTYLIKYNTRTGQRVSVKSNTYKEALVKAEALSKRYSCVSFVYEETSNGYKMVATLDTNGVEIKKNE